jgi:hypothetical protein
MTKNKLSIGLLAGLLLGMVAAFVLSGNPNASRAKAQAQQPPAAAQRYQISAWAHAAGSVGPGSGGSQANHGAYILDTQSGKVWEIIGNGKPGLIGTVGAD